jgi:adenylosuccinate synthase
MKETLNKWQGASVVLDTTWGDSGKGKLVDVMAQEAELVIRFNGGPNAGHTVINEFGEFKFHQIPSGIFNPDAVSVIAGTVAINPSIFIEEVASLKKAGVEISGKNLLVSEDSHLILPWHIIRDKLREKVRGSEKIGTTGQGIGPVFADRAERVGIRAKDLFRPDFEKLFDSELKWQERLIGSKALEDSGFDRQKTLEILSAAKDLMGKMVTNVIPVIRIAHVAGQNILGEGAQGALLDIDLGGYPFVTSTHPTLAGFSQATGIYDNISRVIGVTKAYQTRVGEGPLPTELLNETGELLRQRGREYGATTGRPRRCGWLDIPAVRYGSMIAGVRSLAITKLDILDSFDQIKICTSYRHENSEYYIGYPQIMQTAQPIYITIPGWLSDTSNARSLEDLPQKARDYLDLIQRLTELPIEFVSVGPDRNQSISV